MRVCPQKTLNSLFRLVALAGMIQEIKSTHPLGSLLMQFGGLLDPYFNLGDNILYQSSVHEMEISKRLNNFLSDILARVFENSTGHNLDLSGLSPFDVPHILTPSR